MADYAPIETHYKGYRFRSRLEARWAVFFDSMNIKYVYEPEGFKATSICGNTYCYLPDFYFPDSDCYGEVKGRLSALKEDEEKIAWCIDWQPTPVSKGLIILGQIPYWSEDRIEVPLFPFLYWDKGITLTYAFFGMRRIHKEDYIWDDYSDAPKLPKALWEFPEEIYRLDLRTMTKVDGMIMELTGDEKVDHSWELRQAFMNASQARFEHGEKPIIRI